EPAGEVVDDAVDGGAVGRVQPRADRGHALGRERLEHRLDGAAVGGESDLGARRREAAHDPQADADAAARDEDASSVERAGLGRGAGHGTSEVGETGQESAGGATGPPEAMIARRSPGEAARMLLIIPVIVARVSCWDAIGITARRPPCRTTMPVSSPSSPVIASQAARRVRPSTRT